MHPKICELDTCAKRFLARQKRQRFCSRRCGGIAGRRQRMIEFIAKEQKKQDLRKKKPKHKD